MSISWSQALAWRMQRHLLDPVGVGSVADVVRRLGAVPAMDEDLAGLAVGARRARSRPGEVAGALAGGQIIKSFAFRGAIHYLSPEDGGAYLALRASGRQWELPAWRECYGLGPADWPAFRESVRETLAGGPLTVGELGAAVTRKGRYRHLRRVFDDGAGTLVKPRLKRPRVHSGKIEGSGLSIPVASTDLAWASDRRHAAPGPGVMGGRC